MSIKLLIDGCNGIYIPKRFYEGYDWLGLPNDVDQLSDVDNEFYWEVWEDVLHEAYYIDSHGNKWLLWQDGDLWAYCYELMTDEEKHNLFGE